MAPSSLTANPIRYNDGVVQLRDEDLESAGFGGMWGRTRSWSSGGGYASELSPNGSGMVIAEEPHLVPFVHDVSSMSMAVVLSGTTALFFDQTGNNWQARYYDKESLTHDMMSGDYILTDTAGDQIRFYGSGASQYQFKSYADPAGNTISVVSDNAAGNVTEMQRSATVGGTTSTESLLYSYYSSGDNAGLVSNVTLRRQVNGGAWTTIRQVAYTYYATGEAHGNIGDLKFARVEDASGNVLDTKYYRYYTGEAGGYVHGLKYFFRGPSYDRLYAAVGGDPSSASAASVSAYADNYFEYDSSRRATKEIAAGAGPDSAGGLGTFTYSYVTSTNAAGMNNWAVKTTETLPDGNQNIVYTNAFGEVMLRVFVSGSLNWDSYTQYGSTGLPILQAVPSAVTGYSDTYADLVNGGQYLRQNTGLVTTLNYYTSTTATSSTPGGVAGYLQEIDLRQGQAGTAVPQINQQYIANTANSVTVYLVANQTVYRNADGTGGEQTQYAYTFFSGTNQIQQVTTTFPTVATAENGPGTADQEIVVNDIFGRPIWAKDADGFIHYTAYDPASGGVTKTISDVDTTRTSDFANLPTGWATPSGGGLHLITQYAVDALGRPTMITDPKGNVTYVVYKDTVHETRVYPGWDSGSSMPTGPTQLVRDDRGNGYVETITMSATPHTTGGVPDGTEQIASLQTDTRQYRNAGGQVVNTDSYFSLGGLTYTTATSFGTLGTNFYRTTYAYDSRGRQNKVTSPTGTIDRTDFDGLSRPTASWIGTSDAGNMVQTAGFVYDGGGVGDGNLTAATTYPGLGAPARETDNFYDWRDQLVAAKAGVQASESTSVHRPIMYYELDNLGEITATNQYDGDGASITSSNGVPNKPSASLLRARATASYDEQQRLYRTNVFDVDPSAGTISTNSLETDSWFDHRGDVIKTTEPGGLTTKEAYDGAGRLTATYQVDASADTGWSNAGSVTGNAVLQETDYTLDADGNITETTLRRRFDDQTGTGALGTPTTGVLARDSYEGFYFDKANRLTATVDVGTNGGSAWTTPSSVPARSDTVLVTSQTYTAAGWVQDVTDPRGIVTDNQYDNLGRATQTIEAYDGGAETDSTNKTTQFTYDGSNHLITLTALLPNSGEQQTKFNYGVTTAGSSEINSNDILGSVDHPDKTTGLASSSERDLYTVDGLGEDVTFQDRNGNVHTYTLDVLGRQTADAVTTLGSGVDGTVRRIETAYDTQGNAYLFTSYDQASGGTALNQVKDTFNGLGQLTAQWQEHSGTVTGSSLEVQYGYTEMSGGVNNSRLVSVTYPNGKVLTYNYATGVDNNISRLTSLSDTTGTLESYAYLGLDTVVRRAHPQPGVDLTYIKQTGEANGDAGDKYIGLDRFDRVVDQRWLKTSTGVATDRFQYGYDRDGNRLYRNNLVNTAFGELYHVNGANGYDNLNQMTAFARGTLSASVPGGPLDTIATASGSQAWSLDVMGNFQSQTTNGTQVSRTHNKQNEISTVGANTLTYDNNGNLTTDETGKQMVFDAWNHLVALKNSSGTLLFGYSYDGLSRRITETTTSTTDLYYSTSWQVLEERVSGSWTAQYVWSPVYVDALVLRDRPGERYWVQQDANWNVTAIIDTTGAVVERYIYFPYGGCAIYDANWNALSTNAHAWRYQFQGGRYDWISLYYFRNRDLSASLGRWTENDPMGFAAGDSNVYRYVANQPTTTIDPTGMEGWGSRTWHGAWALYSVATPLGWARCIANREGVASDFRQAIYSGPAANSRDQTVVAGTVGGAIGGAGGGFVGGAAVAGIPTGGVGAIPGGLAAAPWGCAAGAIIGLITGLQSDDPETAFQGGLQNGSGVGLFAGAATARPGVLRNNNPAVPPSGIGRLTGFSQSEQQMIANAEQALRGAGYDTSRIGELVRADMPAGYRGMSIPGGASLGQEAFSSQAMLNHVLEEELIHLQQRAAGLGQSFGPGTAQGLEEAANAARRFPLPNQ